ncbi:hypothetical protein Tco_1048452, partial [Tanacetum coccineum]
SPPNYEWEQLLNIDDSDLPLTPVLRPYNSHIRETTTTTQNPDVDNLGENPVRIIHGPAEYIRKVIENVGEDEDFKGESWVSIVEFVNANRGIVNGCLGDIKNYLKNGKLDQVVKIIKSCTSNAFGDLTVTLKDLSVKVFHKDTVLGNGSGVGGSAMLDEEEIMKLLKEEEEMVELELQVCENVNDQEDQYKLDKEALNLALDEEARASRAEEEWLVKSRQEQELDEKHERQLLGLKLQILNGSFEWKCNLQTFETTLQMLNGMTFGKHLEEKHVTGARFGEKLDKNTTLKACDFHSDAFTKIAQKVKFLIKVMIS